MVTVHTPTQSQQGHKILNVCVVLNHASERSQTFKIWQKDADFFEKQNLFNVLEVVNLRPGGLIETPSKSSASRISPQLCQALKAHTPDLLLVYGGDGTNHSVVQSIMAVAPTLTQLGADTPALLLRGGGTGNDFMRNFHKADHSKLARIVRDYEGLDIDVGKITFPETPEQPVYFLNGANIGYAGWITAYMAKPELQGKWQRNYALATLQAIKSCRPRSYKITFHSEEDSSSSVDAKLANIAFMNGQYFGKGIHITPSAQLNDGKMQLAEIRLPSFFKLPLEVLRLFFSGVEKISAITYKVCQKVDISWSNSELLPVDVDGESYEASGLTVEMLPMRLRILGTLRR